MYYIIALIAANIIISTWAVLSNKKNVLAVILAPLMLLAFYYSYSEWNKLLGYPIPMQNIEIRVVSQTMNTSEQKGYIWGYEAGKTKPRAFFVPLTDGNKKEMQTGERAMQRGYTIYTKEKTYGSDDTLSYRIVRPRTNSKTTNQR